MMKDDSMIDGKKKDSTCKLQSGSNVRKVCIGGMKESNSWKTKTGRHFTNSKKTIKG